MKSTLDFMEVRLMEFLAELERLHLELLNPEVFLQSKDLLLITEDEVCRILDVDVRTLRRYRKIEILRFIKLKGRVYYLKPILYLDLLTIALRRERRRERKK